MPEKLEAQFFNSLFILEFALVVYHFPETEFPLLAPMNTLFLTESLNIVVVIFAAFL